MINKENLYDLIYDKADKLFKEYNPCNIRIKDNVLVCNNKYMCEKHGEDLCCGGCEYLGDDGCTTNCLGCKLGMCWQGHTFNYTFNGCGSATLNHVIISQEFIRSMDKLRKIMHRYGLGRIRCSKEELFNLVTI